MGTAVTMQPRKRRCAVCRNIENSEDQREIFVCAKGSCQHEFKRISRESQKTVDRILGVKTYHRRGAGKHGK